MDEREAGAESEPVRHDGGQRHAETEPVVSPRWRTLLGDRMPPIITSVAFIVMAWAFMLLWGPVVRHQQIWIVPGDIWGTYRAAHYVGWGDIADVYNLKTGLVVPPGIAIVLAPVAMFTGARNLTESIYPTFLAKPTSWIYLGNAMLLLGATTIFAANRLAAVIGVGPRRRGVLCWFTTAPIWLLTVMWGHPEDCLALSLAMFAFVVTFGGRWRISGWLWGAAVAIQPLVLLMFPIALALVARRQRLKTCVRTVIPTIFLLVIPVTTNWTFTSTSLLKQPNFPILNHPTPWMVLAPRLTPMTVGAGPGRLLAIGCAIVLGIITFRLRPAHDAVIWGCAVALSARCFFESVMVPFYLGPPIILCLIAAAARPQWWRLAVVFLAGLALSATSYDRTGEWPYWLIMAGLLMVALVCSWPGTARIRGGSDRMVNAGTADSATDSGPDDLETVSPRTG